MQALATAFRVSPRYVHKLFSAYSDGRGFLKYLQDVRLARVVDRFGDPRDSRTTISEIAWACGFADMGSFARLFKQRYGISPSTYRKGLQGSRPLETAEHPESTDDGPDRSVSI